LGIHVAGRKDIYWTHVSNSEPVHTYTIVYKYILTAVNMPLNLMGKCGLSQW